MVYTARISKVLPDSIAAEVELTSGDTIISINGTNLRDLIDYQFLCADEFLEIKVLDAAGTIYDLEIEKEYDEGLGLEFETALFDGLIQCNNSCPFCFIDQQPPGRRENLYLKDDDYRLSFLYGSYLTLTNLSNREWQRIEQIRLSPLYVSVHSTEGEIRTKLLKNPRAGRIMSQLEWFQDRRLQIHAQVVICPGMNDGAHLERTLRDLASFHTSEVPTVASVAVVPVGLTRFRPQEDELIPVDKEKALEVIEQVQTLQQEFRQKLGSTFVWLADEWFLIAGEDLPCEPEYEYYPQIDNGVGSIRLFIKQFMHVADRLLPKKMPPHELTWVVGNAVERAFQPILERLNSVSGLNVNMCPLSSDYWGQNITVTGLLTGYDLITKLRGNNLGDGVIIPSMMLKYKEFVFLDDIKLEEVSQQLGTPLFPVTGPEELVRTCILPLKLQ